MEVTTKTAAPVQATQPKAAPAKPGSAAKFAQAKADKTLGPKLNATVLSDVKSHDYKKMATDMATMTGQQRLDALQDLRAHHPEEYQALLADMRAGKIESNQVKVGISIDNLKATDWSDSESGKKVIPHLEKQYAAGLIGVGDPDKVGGLGRTDFIDPKATRDGKGTGSVITVSSKLANSPEGMAAVLAHEGQHSQRASIGKMERPLKEETDGNMVMATVWNGYDSTKYEGLERGSALDKTAAFGTSEEKMMGHIAGEYAKDYADKGEWAAAGGVVTDYLEANTHSKGEMVKGLNSADRQALLEATRQVAPQVSNKDWLTKQADWLARQK